MNSIFPQEGSGRRVARALAGFACGLGLAAWAAGSGTPPSGDPSVDFTTSAQSQGEAVAAGTVTLTLSAIHTLDVTVPFTVGGSASLTADYTHTASPAIIPAGSLTVDIDVTLVDDALDEDDETIVFTMGTPVNGTAGSVIEHTFTIIDDDLEPSVEFTSAAQSALEGAGSALATFQLSVVSGRDVTIPFTAAGSANDPADYTADASPLVIPAGSLTVDLDVTLVDDALDEVDETVAFTMGTATNATAGAVLVHTLTITDDDSEPSVEFTSAAQSVSEAAGAAFATLQLSAASGRDVTVPFTVSGSASDPADYTIDASPVLIPAGSLSVPVNVALVSDAIFEGDETVVLTMGAPVNATSGTVLEHTLTIQDDDAQPSVEWSALTQDIDEAGPSGTATLQLSGVSAFEVTVPYTLSGSAADGVDFTYTASPGVIPAGQLTADVTIAPLDDLLDEDDETVVLTIGAPTGAAVGGVNEHTATILDDDVEPVLQFSLASTQVAETAGATVIDLVLSAASGREVSATIALGGDAAENVDYTIDTVSVVIPQGQTAATVTVTPIDDSLNELDETAVLTLGAPVNATLGATAEHTLTLQDDDPEPTVSFRYRRAQADEGDGAFPVVMVLSEVSGRDVSVPVLATGSATDTLDYTLAANPLVIPAGQQSENLVVSIIDDPDDERNERLNLDFDIGIEGATPGAITSTTLVLVDNDEVDHEPTVAGLRPSAQSLAFADARVGEASSVQTVTLQNTNNVTVTLQDVVLEGDHALDFVHSFPVALPIVLEPGDTADVEVIFDSFDGGERDAALRVVQSPAGAPETVVSLFGRAYGPTGAEVLVNAGPDPFLDASGQLWAADYGSSGSSSYVSWPGDIAGTDDDPLYQTSRFGQNFSYSIALPNGFYEVVLHFVDPIMIAPGWRVFDVSAEGQVFVDDLDLFATVGTRTAYVTQPYRLDLTDGVLDLDFARSVGDAIVSAIEVRSVPVINALETSLDFGVVDQGIDATMMLNLQNIGLHEGNVTRVSWNMDGTSLGTGDDFYVEIGGTRYHGGVSSISHTVALPLPGLSTTQILVGFLPTEHQVNELVLELEGDFDETVLITVTGTGGADAGWGFLHPVLDAVPFLVIDYDGNGTEEVQLFGTESHTHEPGRAIVGYEWEEGGMVFSTDPEPLRTFPIGQTTIDLTISDDSVPAATATDNITISVYDADMVPGILVTYFRDMGTGTLFLLDNVPTQGDYIERVMALMIAEQNGMVGGSPFPGAVMVRMEADFEVTQVQDMQFVPSGGIDHRIEIDGVPHTVPEQLSIGTHSLEVRFAVDVLADLPLLIDVFINGQQVQGFGGGLNHSVNGVVPVIHSMPSVGLDLGGNLITIEGFGFWPRDQVIVHWGATDFTYPAGDFVSWQGEEIQLTSPPGSGTIQVTVETPAGTSLAQSFTYSPTGPVPVNWTVLPFVELTNPTTAAWGPDGRLYVGQISGQITAYEFDEDYNVTNGTPAGTGETYVGVSNLTNFDLCGLAFNPFDPLDGMGDPTIYVSHGEHFLNGGGAFMGVSPFTGGIAVLTGPDFDTPVPLITQLPTSNHDHGVNGILFDNNGDLMIAMGGNTNAGIRHPQIGDLPESPLSGAILRARTSLGNFNGQILYEATTTGNPIDDQVLGKHISVVQGDIDVYAQGTRNAYDLTLTTWGHLYATDNGPNGGYGPASTSATTQGGNPHPNTPDELLLVERGLYYGHPNRNRGRFDDRQNVYYDTITPSVPGVFKQNISLLDSSTDGICEYRATAFNNQIRGRLIAQKWNSIPYIVELSDDKREVENIANSESPQIEGLDVITGPGGAIIATNFTDNRLEIAVPDDVAALALTAYEITPWRAPAGGGDRFVIGGCYFGSLMDTTVTIGGQQAALTSVSSKRIVGTIPPSVTGAATDLLDVIVTVGLDTRTIPAGFQYLPAAPGEAQGIWRDSTTMPIPLGEVACGVIDNKMYLFGEGSNISYSYDLYSDFWSAAPAPRTFPGNHHGAEVWGGKLYLFGGLGGGNGKVQIYDPQTNSWSIGADMPWNGGSCSTALIDDLIYVSGGIVGSSTVANLAAYDPALDQWSTNHPTLGAYPAMPTGVNHAASGTDGAKLYVFGGRGGGNFPQPGFDLVQVYDPVTNSWDASNLGGSALTPMPLARGGTGRAVYDDGVFLVMGGESNSAVFGDVQLYDPAANTWTTDAAMPTARHGVYPILFEGRVFVAGGGTTPGFSGSDMLEVLSR